MSTEELLKQFPLPRITRFDDAILKENREKVGIKLLPAICWNGYNLKEVIAFVGLSPNFDKWFKSWEEYEQYVAEHNNIIKLFANDGYNVEVHLHEWIIKLPNGYNVPVRYPWYGHEEVSDESSHCSSGCWDDGNFN